MSKTFSADILGVLVCVRADNNRQVCDIQPRIGYVHSDFQGRPLVLCADELADRMVNEIANIEEEEVKALILGNGARAEKFNITFELSERR